MLCHHTCGEAAGQINDSQDLVVPPRGFESQLLRFFPFNHYKFPVYRTHAPNGVRTPSRVLSAYLEYQIVLFNNYIKM